MVDSATDVACRLRQNAHGQGLSMQCWAGWRLVLTFGPYEEALGPELMAVATVKAAELFKQLHGRLPSDADREPIDSRRDVWHLSVSWTGDRPIEQAQMLLLVELIVALEVPEDNRKGFYLNPRVAHWIWRDK
jgi:hypothetical protein